MENHLDRKEVKEALLKGRGSDERQSNTLSIKQIYEAVLLSDGSVLRLSKNASTVFAFFSILGVLIPSTVVGLPVGNYFGMGSSLGVSGGPARAILQGLFCAKSLAQKAFRAIKRECCCLFPKRKA